MKLDVNVNLNECYYNLNSTNSFVHMRIFNLLIKVCMNAFGLQNQGFGNSAHDMTLIDFLVDRNSLLAFGTKGWTSEFLVIRATNIYM